MIIVHVITGLRDGGAEAVLYRLCMADERNTHHVISLQDGGKYGPLLEEAGVGVHRLEMPRGYVTWGGFWRLIKLMQALEPDVVQTWMYHADLIGGVAARIAGVRRVCWGLHNTTLDWKRSQRKTMLVMKLNAWLSRWVPTRIVSCSRAGVAVHRELGFSSDIFEVIPNGVDLRLFRPDPIARRRIRTEFAIPDGAPLLGMIARFDPQKDHRNLLAALATLKAQHPYFHCLLVGTGMTSANSCLIACITEYELSNHVRLLGSRADIPDIMNALDVHILSSAFGEAFPNVLCEAMACGTPCVTTEVGDAAVIIGETGWCTTPSSSAQLSHAITLALAEIQTDQWGWSSRQEAARNRIANNFSLDRMVELYNKVWQRTACDYV